MRSVVGYILLFSLNLFAFERTAMLMGTYVTIQTDLRDKRYIQQGFSIIREIEKSLSTFDDTSPVSRLNRGESVRPDRYLDEIFTLTQAIYRQSDGYFNVAIGKVTKDLYRFGMCEELPKKIEKQSVDFNAVVREKGYIRLKGVKLDFGGIAKGYAVDKVMAYFKTNGVRKALVALSGDIRMIGPATIQVEDPFGGNMAAIKSDGEAFGISTSGIYRRYIKTMKHNHIINPHTQKPQRRIISLTLFGARPNSFYDAMATAIVAMGLEKGLAFLRKEKLHYILLTSDKKLAYDTGPYDVTFTKAYPSFDGEPHHRDK